MTTGCITSYHRLLTTIVLKQAIIDTAVTVANHCNVTLHSVTTSVGWMSVTTML